MTQLFTVDPDPPCIGKPVKICYTGDLPVIITVTFTPPGTGTDYTLTAAKPCVTVTVPANAVTMVVEGGDSDDYASPTKACVEPTAKAKPKKKSKKK